MHSTLAKLVLMQFMWMVLVLHENLRDNMCGLMQLEYRRTITTPLPVNQAPIFVLVAPLACSKLHPLLAVTTTVSLDVQGTLNMAEFTQMMLYGMESSVEC